MQTHVGAPNLTFHVANIVEPIWVMVLAPAIAYVVVRVVANLNSFIEQQLMHAHVKGLLGAKLPLAPLTSIATEIGLEPIKMLRQLCRLPVVAGISPGASAADSDPLRSKKSAPLCRANRTTLLMTLVFAFTALGYVIYFNHTPTVPMRAPVSTGPRIADRIPTLNVPQAVLTATRAPKPPRAATWLPSPTATVTPSPPPPTAAPLAVLDTDATVVVTTTATTDTSATDDGTLANASSPPAVLLGLGALPHAATLLPFIFQGDAAAGEDSVRAATVPAQNRGAPRIIVGGVPLAGKGTQAELLSAALGAVHVSSHTILRALGTFHTMSCLEI
jgi:hypothetical protein